jgi:hypothetical protein
LGLWVSTKRLNPVGETANPTVLTIEHKPGSSL